ncbi:MAG: enoyl-CoA hydratase-related protein [Acidimicrobiales bacterium]
MSTPDTDAASPDEPRAEVRLERVDLPAGDDGGPERAIAVMVFDHEARRNAMTLEMWQTVPELCAEIEADPTIRVVVLRGAGERAFVAGADISQFTEQRSGEGAGRYDEATAAAYGAIEHLSKPVLACVHGFCVGGGLAISLQADVRYAADDARFALPPAKLGIGYNAAGIRQLSTLVGPAVAKELVYTADLYDAPTALRWGLVNHVLPKAELDDHVMARAALMAERAPLSQRAAKLAIADDPEAETVIDQCFTSADYAEGVAAFLEKRPPRFTCS